MTPSIGTIPIPPLALGTMYFGTTVARDDAFAVLDAAHDMGARFWDTANNYAFWTDTGVGDESEETIGEWFRTRGHRGDVTLATKIGARPAAGSRDLADALGLSPLAIRSQLTDSLRRLRTDHVDVLYAHIDDPATPLQDTLGAMSDLVDEGLVGQVAASNLTAARLQHALTVPARRHYAALQQRFTLLVPGPGVDLGPHELLTPEIEHLAAGGGVTLLGYLALLSGAYTRPERLPAGYDTVQNRALLSTLGRRAAELGVDAGQLALAWMVGRPTPVVPVVGCSRPDHVTAAWQAVHTALPNDLIAELEEQRGHSMAEHR